jgi:hypothetical protein
MMTMSRAISAGQALDYYQQEFTNSKDNYYSEAGEVKGRWSGRLADEWELKGEVTSEQYERLVAGQDPHTGEQLVQAVKARDTVNEFGEKIVTSEHRAGWDATISAPKSVSLAALVGDDERVRDAHRESVNEALKGFEEYLQARGGGDKPSIADIRLAATLEFLAVIDYPLPDWAKTYMKAMETALGDAYKEPAEDVRGYIAYVRAN